MHTDVAYRCTIATATKWSHVSLFLESKKKFMIRLHSSTFVYTRLVTRLHSSSDSSTLVCTRLVTRLRSSALSVTRLHSSIFVSTRLATRLVFGMHIITSTNNCLLLFQCFSVVCSNFSIEINGNSELLVY